MATSKRDITWIFGIPFDNITVDEAVERTFDLVRKSARTCKMIVAPNVEFVMRAQKDHAFYQILRAAELSTPDSIGIMMAGKRQGKPFKTRITGQTFFRAICDKARKEGISLYLLGGKGDTARRAKENAEARYPGLKIAGWHDGYFSEEEEAAVIQSINEAEPNILFVCLGFPRQEKWIDAHKHELKVDVAVGEGGLLDYESGNIKRAPKWMQRAGIEWLWRLILQPSRIKRMSVLPVFYLKMRFSRDVTEGAWD